MKIQTQIRCGIIGTMFFSMFLLNGSAFSTVLDEWSEGLGQSPNAVHSFLFEVTFMKIDVAVIEYQLDEHTAAKVSSITNAGEINESLKNRVAETLLASEAIAISMDVQRDTNSGKIMKGMGKNLTRALESELISQAEHDQVLERLTALLSVDEERGILEGDRLMYRVQPDAVRVFLLGVDGKLLVDSLESGPAWTKGIKGIFLGPDSKLRDKFAEAAWPH